MSQFSAPKQGDGAILSGVISDTHGLLRPEAEERLAGVDHIIHAGDIGSPDIVQRLECIAPTTAIRGNVDTQPWARMYPATAMVTLAGRSIYALHDIGELDLDPVVAGFAIVIFGHSHRPTSRPETAWSSSTPAAPGRGVSGCRSRWRRST